MEQVELAQKEVLRLMMQLKRRTRHPYIGDGDKRGGVAGGNLNAAYARSNLAILQSNIFYFKVLLNVLELSFNDANAVSIPGPLSLINITSDEFLNTLCRERSVSIYPLFT